MVHCNYGRSRISGKTICIYGYLAEFHSSHKNSSSAVRPEQGQSHSDEQLRSSTMEWF